MSASIAPGLLVRKATANALRRAWTVERTPAPRAILITVSQIDLFDRSGRLTLAGRRFGITQSSGPHRTAPDSQASRRICASSSGIVTSTTLPPFSCSRTLPNDRSTSRQRSRLAASRRAPTYANTERHRNSCQESQAANMRPTSSGVTITTSASPGLGRRGRLIRAIGLTSTSPSRKSHAKRPFTAL